VAPGALPERRCSKRQVETAEHEVWDAEVYDEHSGSVANLWTDRLLQYCHRFFPTAGTK
jgi:hypothetical protein